MQTFLVCILVCIRYFSDLLPNDSLSLCFPLSFALSPSLSVYTHTHARTRTIFLSQHTHTYHINDGVRFSEEASLDIVVEVVSVNSRIDADDGRSELLFSQSFFPFFCGQSLLDLATVLYELNVKTNIQ